MASQDNQAMPLRWTIFCRVIDNHGDLGVCWRLARTLAAMGDEVTLRVDEASALAWMAGEWPKGVQAMPFDVAAKGAPMADVVVEAFGCDPPRADLLAMRRATHPPTWINLEYFSAEPYVARCHGLASPQLSGPAQGLTKWFFYPGLAAQTGGLLPAPAQGWPQRLKQPVGARLVSVLAYAHAELLPLLEALACQPTVVLGFAGPSLALLQALHASGGWPPGLGLVPLPPMSQMEFDGVLATCAFNVVRGEDSLVSALRAGAPFAWNIYAQNDGAHVVKLEAMLDAWATHLENRASLQTVQAVWRSLNGLKTTPLAMGGQAPLPSLDERALAEWQACLSPWQRSWQARDNLAVQLRRFALDKAMPEQAAWPP